VNQGTWVTRTGQKKTTGNGGKKKKRSSYPKLKKKLPERRERGRDGIQNRIPGSSGLETGNKSTIEKGWARLRLRWKGGSKRTRRTANGIQRCSGEGTNGHNGL